MESQDYPIEHFDHMSRLARALKALPAQVLAHDYSAESFGSWVLVVRYNGKVSQLVYDGREGQLRIQRSDDRKPPYKFGAEQGIGASRSGASDAMVIEEICRSVAS